MTTETPPRETEPVSGFWRLVPEPSLDVVRRWGWASVVVNIGIVVDRWTGPADRLGAGLPDLAVVHRRRRTCRTAALGIHGAIEFGNRMLGFVVAVVAICTWLVVMRYRPMRKDLRRLATAAALGVPLQAVIGGISVLTGLNPWIVSAHFLVSPIIITLTVAMMRRSRTSPYPHTPPVVRALATASVVAVWLAVALGTLVTGAGPHSGDPETGRNGFDETSDQPAARGRRLRPARRLDRAGDRDPRDRDLPHTAQTRRLAAGVGVLQGAVGFTQYFTGLPWGLVLVHMFFAGRTDRPGHRRLRRTRYARHLTDVLRVTQYLTL